MVQWWEARIWELGLKWGWNQGVGRKALWSWEGCWLRGFLVVLEANYGGWRDGGWKLELPVRGSLIWGFLELKGIE